MMQDEALETATTIRTARASGNRELGVAALWAAIEGLVAHLDAEALVLDATAVIVFANARAERSAPGQLFRQAFTLARTDGSPVTPEEDPVASALAGESMARVLVHRAGREKRLVELTASPLRVGPERYVLAVVRDLARPAGLHRLDDALARLSAEFPRAFATELFARVDAAHQLDLMIERTQADLRLLERARRDVDVVRQYERGMPLRLADHALLPIVEHALEAAEEQQPSAVRVTVAVDPAHRVQSNEFGLPRALACLLENALRDCDPGAPLKVESARRGDRVELAIHYRSRESAGSAPRGNASPRPFCPARGRDRRNRGLGLGTYQAALLMNAQRGTLSLNFEDQNVIASLSLLAAC